MKKFALPLALIALCSAGCSVDPLEENLRPDTQPSDVTRNGTVPLDEALDELQSLIGDIERHTRAEGVVNFNRAIRDIAVCGGAAATRNGDTPLPDTLVYVVNFTDDKGFALLGAQRSLEPVYALTEAGSLDPEKLNDAIAYAARYTKSDTEIDSRSENESDSYIGVGPEFIYRLLGETLANTASPRIAADTLYKSYGTWRTESGVEPLVKVKWNQCYPFNIYMPATDTPRYNESSQHKGHFPVGCGVIAAAQIMATNRLPSYATDGLEIYNWDHLTTVSNYLNAPLFASNKYPNDINSTIQLYTNQLASVLRYLAVLFKADSNEEGTGTSASDIIEGLKILDKGYYANARIREDNMVLPGIYSCLENNKPAYISGYYWENGWFGHAWIADGYFTRCRDVTTVIRYGLTGPTQTLTGTEEIRYLHFNWGYGGNYDGYFAEGIYDMSQRYCTDSTIDVNTSTRGSSNYNINNLVISY